MLGSGSEADGNEELQVQSGVSLPDWLSSGLSADEGLGAASDSCLFFVFLSVKPFLMSASRASMTHTSSCFISPFLTGREGWDGVTPAPETGQQDTAVMPLLEVPPAAPAQAATGQEQGTHSRPGSSSVIPQQCSMIPQQPILAEHKGFAPKSWCYSLAQVAPALAGHIPGCPMTVKYSLFVINVGGNTFFFFLRKNNFDFSFLSASSNCIF